MTLKGGTASACAACKYQRRKCVPECRLAPYFPADQPKVFQNAHKVFGVSNIVKILKGMDPSQHAEAMRSIKYQANMRDRFPVYGCLGIIHQLYCQIHFLEEESRAVIAQLEMYRQHPNNNINSTDNVVLGAPPSLQLELGMAPPPPEVLPLFNQLPNPYTHICDMAPPVAPVSMQHSYNPTGGYSSSYADSKENNVVVGENNISSGIQNPFIVANNNNNGSCSPTEMLVPNSSSQLQGGVDVAVQDYDEIHPFFDTIDDRQSFIDCKEAYDSCSSEESPNEMTALQSMEPVGENELKSAAACFTLISLN